MTFSLWVKLAVFVLELVLAIWLMLWLRGAHQDKPLPWTFLLKLFCYGGIVALVCAFITMRYSFDLTALEQSRPALVEKFRPLMVLLNTFSGALIEELGKYAVAVFILITTPFLRRLSDTLFCLIIIGLGFTIVEDLAYLAQMGTDAPYRLLSFYLHSGTSAVIGYSLGRFRFGLTGYREMFVAVTSAVLLHFGFNLATQIGTPTTSLALTAAIMVLITLQIFILFKKTLVEEYVLTCQIKPKKYPTALLNLKTEKSHS